MAKSKGRRLAEWLRNLDSNSKASSDTLADDSVSTAKLQTDAVTNPKIADGAVHTANLADANVTFAKLHTDVTITSSTGISGSNDNDTTVPTTAALIDYVGAQIQTKDNSDEITEGSTNLYYTDARVASYLSTNGYGTSSSIIASITDSAPTTLDTLNELAAALGDDANFSTTVTNSIGTKWTQDNTKISNWDTAYGWGNHASAGYLTSFDITTQTDPKYLRSDVNDQMLAQLSGGFGAVTTGGTTNWNDSTNARSGGGYTLLTGSASNGPGGSTYYHPFSFEYSSKNGTGNMTQLAIPYNGSSIWHRYRFSNSWTGWVQEWNSGNDGSGSGLDADTLDGIQGASFLRSDADDSFSGNLSSADNGWIKFYAAEQTDSNDGKIGSGVFGTGLNIVGAQTSSGLGRQVRIWGNVLTNDGNSFWHAGNDGSGSGLDADTVDGIQGSNILTLSGSQTITGTKTFSAASGNIFLLNDTNASNTTNANIYFYFQANGSNLGYIGYGSGATDYLYITNPSAPVYLAGSSVLLRGGYEAWGADNDGSGSGLDADLWDGNQFSSYLNQALLTTSSPTFNTVNYTNALYAYESSNYIGSDPRWNNSGNNANEGCHHMYATTGSGAQWGQTGLALYNGGAYVFLTTKSGDSNWYHNNNKMWSAGNDGSGSGLDADTLDGYQLGGGSGAVGETIFNNQGRSHSATTNFNSTALRAGVNYLQGGTNGPTGSGQWYGFRLGLGSQYGTTTGSGGHYASELYWSRKNQTSNNYYIYTRDMESGNWGSWVKMSAGNSDLLSGYSLSTGGVNVVLRTQANGYIIHQNWIQVGNGTGLYCPNGAYFYNDTTYGWFARSSNSSSGSVRLQTNNGTNRGWFYADSSYQQGFLTSAGGWGLKMDNSGNVTATGNVTAYSDLRLKEDIKPLENALAKVLQLRGVQYTRKDTKEKEIGVIAQEIENILPEVVHISDSTAQEEGKETYTDIRSVDYGRMVSVLIEAIKEQQAQINELKEKIKWQ